MFMSLVLYRVRDVATQRSSQNCSISRSMSLRLREGPRLLSSKARLLARLLVAATVWHGIMLTSKLDVCMRTVLLQMTSPLLPPCLCLQLPMPKCSGNSS